MFDHVLAVLVHAFMCTDVWCDWSDCVAIPPGVVNVNRYMGLLQHAHQIRSKEQSNKNIIDIMDIITRVEALVDKSNQLFEANFAKKTDSMAVDR